MGERRKEVLTLPLLQSRIAKDSASYRDEFLLRLRHFDAQCTLVEQSPESATEEFAELATFLANTAVKYASDASAFPARLVGLLEAYAAQFSQEVRRRLCVAAMTLRVRGMLAPARLLELLLGLLRVPDRQLRTTLLQRIVADVRAANKKAKNQRLNSALQNVLSRLISESGPPGRLALGLLVELYRRGVWADARTVNIIAEAAVTGDSRLAAIALQFFVAPGDAAAATGVGRKEDSDSDSEPEAVKALRRAVQTHARSGKHRTKKMRKLLEQAKRKHASKNEPLPADVTALRLLHDPHAFVEKLLGRCRGSTGTIVKWDTKLLMFDVASRCIAAHKLIILRFYSIITGYLQPHQQDITRVLAIAAQSVHDLVPPEALTPVLRALADRFISDRSRPEAIAAGLNTVRAMTARSPHALPPDLLRDLAMYKNDRDKAVAAAARSLIAVYRAANPELLARRDRGRPQGTAPAPLYGEQRVALGIDGTELLPEARARAGVAEAGGDEEWAGASSAADSDSDEDGEGWVSLSDGEGPGGDEQGSDGWETASDSGEETASDSGEESGEGWVTASDDGSDAESDKGDADDSSGSSGDSDSDSGSDSDSRSGSSEASDSNAASTDEQSGHASRDDVAAPVAAAAAAAEPAPSAPPTRRATLEEQIRAAEERAAREIAARVEAQRILTPKDFELLREARQKQLAESLKQKGKRPAPYPPTIEPDDLENPVRAEDIEVHKRVRATKEERLATVEEGREGRRKFGSTRGQDKGGGSTNAAKLKSKPFAMVKPKIQKKKRVPKHERKQKRKLKY